MSGGVRSAPEEGTTMRRTVSRALGIGPVCLGLSVAGGRGLCDDDKPKPNTNALVKQHRDKLTVTASSFWPNWPPQLVIDGNHKKSWFTAQGDTISRKTKPWVQITFPVDV